MNKLKELRKKVRKNNKGFSLVELIVVIVILAILIGVTIGGIYQYVNKSRVNTDINNAASIQSVIATVATDANVIKAMGDNPVTIVWGTAVPTIAATNVTCEGMEENDKKSIADKLQSLLTDGLPASKSNGAFKIEIKKDTDGNVTATCKAYDNSSPRNVLKAEN